MVSQIWPLVRQLTPTQTGSAKWFLDEVFLKINGKTQYVWQAVDQDGNVLDILVQSRRGVPGSQSPELSDDTLTKPARRMVVHLRIKPRLD
jgi:transposase-like protein